MGDEALKPLFSRRIGKEETIGVDTSQYKKAMAFGSLRFTKRGLTVVDSCANCKTTAADPIPTLLLCRHCRILRIFSKLRDCVRSPQLQRNQRFIANIP